MKKYSGKFWITFTVISVLFLFGWFVFWEVKSHGWAGLKAYLGILPVKEETRTDFGTVLTLADSLLHTGGKEKTFLILFQNNMELRPGGGYIGSFGILKVRDGNVTLFQVHDTSNFDGRIPDTIAPPYPMKETLKIPSWKFRDSNWSPDFSTNVNQAEDFYRMGQGTEEFDGVVAITANVLTSFLKVTGPVEVPGYPGTYGSDNAIHDLEYQVERGFLTQNLDIGERKSPVMSLLGQEIIKKVKALPLTKKYELYRTVMADLHQKDVQLSFRDPSLQEAVHESNWDGLVDQDWKDDYFMAVDANLSAFKSDYYMRRSYDYTVDLSGVQPKAVLSVHYTHTAKEKDFMTTDYQSYLRIYAPKGSYLTKVTNAGTDPHFGDELGKKVFGVLIHVPLGTEKTVTFEYNLPANIQTDWYDLKVQKQPGVNDIPVHVTVIKKDGTKEEKSFTMSRDAVYSEVK